MRKVSSFHQPLDRFGLIAPMTELAERYEDRPDEREGTAAAPSAIAQPSLLRPIAIPLTIERSLANRARRCGRRRRRFAGANGYDTSLISFVHQSSRAVSRRAAPPMRPPSTGRGTVTTRDAGLYCARG